MSELHGIATLEIRPGKLAEFERLAAQCMESVRTRDTGTLRYDWFFGADRARCVVLEHYRDSAALLEHVANLGTTFGALLETCSLSFELFGSPSAELVLALQDLDVRYYAPFQSIR